MQTVDVSIILISTGGSADLNQRLGLFMMDIKTQAKYANRINEVNLKRSEARRKPLQEVWCNWQPSCKMRVVGVDLKGFTRRFVINQINISENGVKK